MSYFLLVFAVSLMVAWRFGIDGRSKPLVILLWVLSALLGLFYFISDRLSGNGIDESVLYHLQVGLKGAAVSEFYLEIIGGLLCVSALVFAVAYAARRIRKRSRFGWPGLVLMSAVMGSLALNPALPDIHRLAAIYSAGEPDYHASAEHFPSFQGGVGAPGKNIVYVYLEGLERTYLDERLFPGLTPHLSRLDKQGLSFTNLQQVYGTGWTIAGIVASQCGMPLVAASGANTMTGMDSFLPGATCLGDILTRHGYGMSFMGGADLEFAGKGKFFNTHRYASVEGLRELKDQMPDRDYRSAWGLYDDTLFDLAKSRYDDLADTERPFGLVLLTVDTHHPRGHMSRQCEGITYADGKNPILNAVHCADRLVASLVEHIAAHPAGRETVVVLASDHLGMPNTASELLMQGQRRNLFLVLNSGLSAQAIDRSGSTMDVAPTLVSLLGGRLDALGYGRNLLAEEPTLTERYQGDVSAVNRFLAGSSDFLKGFWRFPDLAAGIELAGDDRVNLGGRVVSAPVLMALGDGLSVDQVYFEINSPLRLYQQVQKLSPDQAFAWIDKCSGAISKLTEARVDERYCLFVGSLGKRGGLYLALREGDEVAPEVLRSALLGKIDQATLMARQTALRDWSVYQVRDVVSYAPPADLAGSMQGKVGIRSASGSEGGSFLFDMNGRVLALERGLTLVGFKAGGEPRKLAYVDSCGGETAGADWSRGLGHLLERYAPQYGAFAVVAHDSAMCGKRAELAPLFEGGPLSRWKEIGFRTPYIGLIAGNGKVKELPGKAEEAIALEAKAFIKVENSAL